MAPRRQAVDSDSYGAFSGRGQIDANGKQAVAASVGRYIARMSQT
jgi:hypothetical protein